MDGGDVVGLLAALAALVAVTVAVNLWAGLGQARAGVVATLRALVQLLAVGAVIGVVFRTPGLAPLYLLLMLGVAAWTSGRRLRRAERAVPAAATAIAAGAGVGVAAILGCRALPF